jgi:hypothetical protein
VTADIEGDHITALIWRGRLTLFWLTFAIKGGLSANPSAGTDTRKTPGSKLTDMSFGDLASVVVNAKPPTTVQIQLNWSEYFQGQWSPRKSSDIKRFNSLTVNDDFNPVTDLFVHASIDYGSTGSDSSVPDPVEAALVHLDSPSNTTNPIDQSFRLTSKNSEPSFSSFYWHRAWTPYNSSDNGFNNNYDASKYIGYDSSPKQIGVPNLNVNLPAAWVVSGDTSTQLSAVNEKILKNVNSFTLLPCDNLSLPTLPSYYHSFAEPTSYLYQVGVITSPFFYADSADNNNSKELAFFVQPSLIQKVIVTWNSWVLNTKPDPYTSSADYWNNVLVKAQVPIYNEVNPADPQSLYTVLPGQDRVTQPGALVSFNSGLVANPGGVARAANGALLPIAPRAAAALLKSAASNPKNLSIQ